MDGQWGKPTDVEVGAAANPKVGAVDMGMIPTATDAQRVADLEIPSQGTLSSESAHRANHGVSARQGKVQLVA